MYPSPVLLCEQVGSEIRLAFASSSLKANYFLNVSIVNVILDSKYKILVVVLDDIK